MLFDTLLKTLRRATNVPTITVAHKEVNKIATVIGRQHVFLRRGQELSGCKNNTWFDGNVAAFDCTADLFFEPRRNVFSHGTCRYTGHLSAEWISLPLICLSLR